MSRALLAFRPDAYGSPLPAFLIGHMGVVTVTDDVRTVS
jgi:hypothetical protein